MGLATQLWGNLSPYLKTEKMDNFFCEYFQLINHAGKVLF